MKNLRIYKELLKESLFNEWTDELLRLNSLNGNDDFAFEIWDTATLYAYSIATAEYPLGMFKICRSKIQNKYFILSLSYTNVYETCLGCIYTMIIKSADKAVVKQIMDYISVNQFFPIYLDNKIRSIIDKINNGELNDGYDYCKKKDSQNADANKVNTTDNGKTQELEKRIQELEKNKEELEEELAEYKKGPIVDKPHNKVVLELFVKLLEKSGVDFKVRCNKAIAARLAEYVTGIKKDACNKYMCYKDLSTSYHKDEVNKVNDQLRLLNINIKL
ncbi:MAG: hypothetical protein MR645_08265 [Paraprevotella sp.]|nr:hypothetical protein [Paraprevotella sp.]